MSSRLLILVIFTSVAITFTGCGNTHQPARAPYLPLAEVEAAYGPLITAGNHPTPDQHGTGERVGLFQDRSGGVWGLPLTMGAAAHYSSAHRGAFTRGRSQTHSLPALPSSAQLISRPAGAAVREVWNSCSETLMALSAGARYMVLNSIQARSAGHRSLLALHSGFVTTGWLPALTPGSPRGPKSRKEEFMPETGIHAAQLILLLLLLFVAAFAALARRIYVPYPIVLVAAGAAARSVRDTQNRTGAGSYLPGAPALAVLSRVGYVLARLLENG